jgi:hypothetical protein
MAWRGDAALVDIASFGETGLLPARRGPDGLPAPIAHGAIAIPRGAQRTIAAIETRRSTAGTLALRGPMVPAQAFAPGGDAPIAPDSFVDTGYACRLDRATGTIAITAPLAGITAVGGYRFHQHAIDAAVAAADPAAIIAALPDALLGQRLAGSARDPASTAATLRARGAHALLVGAFRSASRAVAAG